MRLGVIADDFTGAVDIAGFLVAGGMRTVMCSRAVQTGDCDAIVMSLKIRSIPKEQAIKQALASLTFLKECGCDRFYYKYCSTFDSTAEGNIGPVADALRQALHCSATLICPALPVNKRTVFHGYLFVNDELLSDCPMRHHPLNPMHDSKLARILSSQSPAKNGHVYHDVIKKGSDVVRQAIDGLKDEGVNNIIVDVVDDEDLTCIAEATQDFTLVTGGSGLAQGITEVWRRTEKRGGNEAAFVVEKRKAVVIAGSCSAMMQKQVAYYKKHAPSLSIDEQACLDDPEYGKNVATWVLDHQDQDLAPLVYATRSPIELEENRKKFGDVDVSSAIEHLFARLTALLAEQGVQTFIVGGGETSGVVATTLGVDAYRIGAQIDPGVSWVRSLDGSYQLVLKSGNFGSEQFLLKAQEMYNGNQ